MGQPEMSLIGFTADDLLVFPIIDELKRRIMGTPMVRCDDIPWSKLGLSMAGWNGLISLLLGAGALSLTWRSR